MIIAVIVYGIAEGYVDYSFYLAIVGAVLSIIAGIIGSTVKLAPPRSSQVATVSTAAPVVVHTTNPVQVAQGAYPPQFNQAYMTPNYPMAPGYGQPFVGGPVPPQGGAYAMPQAPYPPHFDQGITNPGYGMDPPPYSEATNATTEHDAEKGGF